MPPAQLSLTRLQIQTALVGFFQAILPAGIEVFEGQDNRVPEPVGPDFIVFWPIRKSRLTTNIDTRNDCRFTGSIALTVLTVSAISYGSIVLGRQLFGTGVADNTIVTAQLTGPAGGVGTYSVNNSQTVTSEILATSAKDMLMETELVYQCDVHGPNSQDYSQIIQTCFRDEYGVGLFAASGFNLAPLYADEPRQAPFINENEQVEWRWTIDLHLQINPVVTVPQQYADKVDVSLVSVTTAYPP